MKSTQITVIAIMLVCVSLIIGYEIGKDKQGYGYDQGYKDGKAYVCNSPQVPFRTVNLPACR